MIYDRMPAQFAYPTSPAIYPAPMTAADPRTFELIPHRIFVGGFPVATTELDLRTFFEQFGHVREVKLIRGNEGTSKGYGFITFDTEEEAKQVLRIANESEGSKLDFKGRKLNLGPALRRMVYGPRFVYPFPGSPYGGSPYPFVYPQSPMMVVPSPTMQPSFVYSPASLSNSQLQFSTPQQSAGAPATATPNNSPRSGVAGTVAPLAVNSNTVGNQQVVQSDSLTQSAPVPRGTTYYTSANAPTADMTHYSQMTPQLTYYYVPGSCPSVDMNGQPVGMQNAVAQSSSVVSSQLSNVLQPYYGDAQMNAWENAAVEQQILDSSQLEVGQRNAGKGSSLGGRFNQIQRQQQYESRDGGHGNSGIQSKRY